MAKQWVYKYGQNTITVENTWFSGEKLYVNGALQDESRGLKLSGSLRGKLDTGEEIKATLGGTFTVGCSLFIDNKLQTPQRR
jgi:hypothetical protein